MAGGIFGFRGGARGPGAGRSGSQCYSNESSKGSEYLIMPLKEAFLVWGRGRDGGNFGFGGGVRGVGSGCQCYSNESSKGSVYLVMPLKQAFLILGAWQGAWHKFFLCHALWDDESYPMRYHTPL